MISFLNPDIGAAHSVELLFVFNLRGPGTASSFNGTNISDEIFTTIQQMWTNFARCGNPSTDDVEWKAYRSELEETLVEIGGQVTEYYDALVRRLIERITVHDDRYVVEFKSGIEIDVRL